jgi:D-serine dehydratase
MQIEALKQKKPALFLNPKWQPVDKIKDQKQLSRRDLERAEKLMHRFAPLLVALFPELRPAHGIIESPLIRMQHRPWSAPETVVKGSFWIKCDHALPVAGSIKARGGIFEVLWHTENLAMHLGLLKPGDDYKKLNTDKVRRAFGKHTVEVGSTGNLGLSIGIMASALGFKTCVHMSAGAKEWKKVRLRRHGVTVVEHDADYSKAVQAGREMAAANDHVYFVDDENSKPLFLGYSIAAMRLQHQMNRAGIKTDHDNPLFVYLPCGVGGAPGGITFGLKMIFGDDVHCFFAEPVQAPGMTLAMLHDFETFPSVYAFGLTIATEADGLAVGTASKLVGKIISNMLSGCYTVTDQDLFMALYHLKNNDNISVEPSAAAGLPGAEMLFGSRAGLGYIERHGLSDKMDRAHHIVWTTGGCFAPEDEHARFYENGKRLAQHRSTIS